MRRDIFSRLQSCLDLVGNACIPTQADSLSLGGVASRRGGGCKLSLLCSRRSLTPFLNSRQAASTKSGSSRQPKGVVFPSSSFFSFSFPFPPFLPCFPASSLRKWYHATHAAAAAAATRRLLPPARHGHYRSANERTNGQKSSGKMESVGCGGGERWRETKEG